jgi:hypothetical protein
MARKKPTARPTIGPLPKAGLGLPSTGAIDPTSLPRPKREPWSGWTRPLPEKR